MAEKYVRVVQDMSEVIGQWKGMLQASPRSSRCR